MRRLIANKIVRRFLSAQEGATAIEYAVIAAGIGGVLVAVITALGGSVAGKWNAVAAIF
jgi:pilus assembly protein Flp/PilA